MPENEIGGYQYPFDQQQPNDRDLQPITLDMPTIVGEAVIGAIVKVLERLEPVRHGLQPVLHFCLIEQACHQVAGLARQAD